MTESPLNTPRIALVRSRATGAFERRVARSLASHVDPDAPIVVACSGGPDSLATLVAVARTRPTGSVTAAHFDHRLRTSHEVATERALVEQVCAVLGTGFLGGRAARVPVDHGEAAAREARYRWLARACAEAGATVCVTGHTLDDQAETVLLRLVRGTGVGGASGMSPASDWPVPLRGVRASTLVRPLLGVERAEVEAYLVALGLSAAHDPSNDTLDYARNRVRQRVVPELRLVNRRAPAQIAAFADRARADDAALHAWAVEVFSSIAQVERDPAGIRLDRRALLDLPEAVATRVVRLAGERLGVTLDSALADATLHAAHARGRRAALGQDTEAARQGDALVIRRAPGRSGESPRQSLPEGVAHTGGSR